MTRRRSALLLSGVGRYADPWHPFAETSRALAGIVEEAGYDVEIAPDVDDALAALEHLPDLLVVNVGQPRDGEPSPAAGLTRYLRSGRPLLALHSSATSFTESDEWERTLGGRWVEGVSMHPEQGDTVVTVEEYPLVADLADFSLNDERYSFLRVAADVQVLVTHEHDGVRHPLVWLREAADGRGRAAYDALGHDARSFDSPEHREILRRLISWVAAG
ncbi:ThuA domain-containing protein [Rathayibacter sp. VKM Ac-2754]|uniref:ThuA domain-containing protein n=1 Tax=Rathayibacter sp. VKM Ac-2754 TaxID=2609251 RepID=UPI001357A043|nr:ThuA domain-containing protein [Rathayibacter sp. VKM Ac-2754]MWV58907.1 ThuA domain-containing protein [Rathayibacter sp. VKM Ac-2754]